MRTKMVQHEPDYDLRKITGSNRLALVLPAGDDPAISDLRGQ
jgi:hypothetical protein